MADEWYPPGLVTAPTPTRFEWEFAVPGDSAWFSGHFPGRPIMPGVGMLALAIETLRRGLGEPIRLSGVKKLRFKGVVCPGDRMWMGVDWQRTQGSIGAKIQLRRNDEDIGSGQISLVPVDGEFA